MGTTTHITQTLGYAAAAPHVPAELLPADCPTLVSTGIVFTGKVLTGIVDNVGKWTA